MLPEYFALNLVRLDNDWSFHILSDKMAEAEAFIPWRTLHYLLTHEDSGERSRDRTLHKVRKFLKYAHKRGWIDADSSKGEPDAPQLRGHNVSPARKRKRPVLRAESVSRR
jgi:hypothetical protein